MAFEIVWTKRASGGYDRIINYLEKEWTQREVSRFVKETDLFFQTLCNHPEILQKSSARPNLYRGPINRLTILSYTVNIKKNTITLVNIRGARQKPLKE